VDTPTTTTNDETSKLLLQPQQQDMKIVGFQCCRRLCQDRLYLPLGLRIYLTQPISWAGISLSLL
jgi:hypothetical protein